MKPFNINKKVNTLSEASLYINRHLANEETIRATDIQCFLANNKFDPQPILFSIINDIVLASDGHDFNLTYRPGGLTYLAYREDCEDETEEGDEDIYEDIEEEEEEPSEKFVSADEFFAPLKEEEEKESKKKVCRAKKNIISNLRPATPEEIIALNDSGKAPSGYKLLGMTENDSYHFHVKKGAKDDNFVDYGKDYILSLSPDVVGDNADEGGASPQ